MKNRKTGFRGTAFLSVLFAVLVTAARADDFYVDTGDDNIFNFTAPNNSVVFASGYPQSAPQGLAVDNAGDVFEANANTGQILEYTSPNTYSVYASGLDQPTALAFNSSGDLFVSELGTGQILDFTAPNTSAVYASGLTLPTSMAFNNAGDLYVSDAGAGKIYTDNGTGNIFEFTAPNTSTIFASGLNNPRGIAIAADNTVYVAENNSDGDIRQFTAPNTSTVFASGLYFPYALGISQSNNLLVGTTSTISDFTAANTSTVYATNLFYPTSFAFPKFSVQETSQTPNSALTTLSVIASTQLQVFSDGLLGPTFSSGGLINPAEPTIVLTHGWESNPGAFDSLAASVLAANPNVNILAWNWTGDADTLNLGGAAASTLRQGQGLGAALAAALGSNYNEPIQFVGHSLGTLVNAQAVETLDADDSALTAANTQVTLFDDAGIIAPWISPIPSSGTSAALTIDNYISSVGQLHSQAENVILDKPFGMDEISFHGYPITWYTNTVGSPSGSIKAGYNLSITTGVTPGNIANTYFDGATNGTLTAISGSTAATQIQNRDLGEAATTLLAPLSVADLYAAVQIEGHVQVTLNNALSPIIELIKHSPSYAWLPISIPADATTMQLDFEFSGLSQGDWLSVGIGDTALFSLEDEFAGDGQLDTSTPMDVSSWAGQDVQLFLGLNPADENNVGGNITVSNISFGAVPEPSILSFTCVASCFLACKGLRRKR